MQTPQPIEICRTGRFTSMQGRTVEFTDADLAGMVTAYDNENEPAPLVVGHPKLTDPAYGWVERLEVRGDKLVALPRDIEPSFAEIVAAKHFARVSPEFYPPAHPSNPRPNSWYLKHVGFLGAAAPAIRGLRPVSFSDDQHAGAVTLNLDPKELMMADDTQEQAFAEREASLDTREQSLADREAAIATREQDAATAAAKARHDANDSFAEGLVAGGKLKPFGKDKLVGLLDVLDATELSSFGDAGELAPIDVFKEMLTAADPFISFGELAKDEGDKPATVSFAAPAGFTVDATALEIHGKAIAHQVAHPGVTYIDAVKAVS